jgi:hypothetical protein
MIINFPPSGQPPFKASNGWRQNFLKRNPSVLSKMAQGLERTRVGGLNVELATMYFNLGSNRILFLSST